MSKFIAINSLQRGVGKSNLTANIATLMAAQGKRVGVVDINFQVPGMHPLLCLYKGELRYTLHDYLTGKATIMQCVLDVTNDLHEPASGAVFFVSASHSGSYAEHLLQSKPHTDMFIQGMHALLDELDLDVLFFDTTAGLHAETLVAMALSDTVLIILRLDRQDYQGTSVTVEVAAKLGVPEVMLIVNEAPPIYDTSHIKLLIEQTYQCEVSAILPHSDELMALASSNIFALRYPHHPITTSLQRLTSTLLA